MIGHWWLYGRKWPRPPLPKRKLGLPSIQEVHKKFEIFPGPSCKTRKNLAPPPPQKKILWLGGVYTMEDKDTNTDCQKFVRVGDQKWDIVEITIGIIFFTWDLYSLCFIQGVFKSHLKKITPPLKCQFSPKTPIWHKSLQYKRSEKWLSRGGGANCVEIPQGSVKIKI